MIDGLPPQYFEVKTFFRTKMKKAIPTKRNGFLILNGNNNIKTYPTDRLLVPTAPLLWYSYSVSSTTACNKSDTYKNNLLLHKVKLSLHGTADTLSIAALAYFLLCKRGK